nr:hypothetical protein [Tanacetum cinerariifolium]
RKNFVAVQDAQAKSVDHAAELSEHLTTMDIEFDTKFKESYEYQSRLGKAISLDIEDIQNGLEAEVIHCKANMILKGIKSYDVEAGAKFLAVVKDRMENMVRRINLQSTGLLYQLANSS